MKIAKSKNLVKSKNQDFSPNFRNMKIEPGFLTPKARLAFTKLRQALIETSIFYHFDPECHIRIETNVSGYAIGEI